MTQSQSPTPPGRLCFGCASTNSCKNLADATPRFVWLNILLLATAALLPFFFALGGEYSWSFFSQAFYAVNMVLLSVTPIFVGRYIYLNPAMAIVPMSLAEYMAARFRGLGLSLVAAIAVLLAWFNPAFGSMAFMLMLPVATLSRRIAAKHTHVG